MESKIRVLDLVFTVVVAVVGAIGGVVSVLLDKEKAPTPKRLLVKGLISAFVGFITGVLLKSMYLPDELIFGLCGMSGLASVELINLYKNEIIQIMNTLCGKINRWLE